ncbi:uncharacterized protein DUF3127 [Sinobacterium caligoides]|uniref:Uncharacterized protein DUF3127 n=1 Tax=Sinobacterium caligoides TaxID=933926 RepID=A0A3N2DKC5_9GAMM|nr:DUF3127 domain-containing protein [Sinobacterium caligoides]ROS00132.1 uncharacterized protein DUF3127 [Sinobacterium caligoides]
MSKSFEVQGEIHSIGDTTEYGNNGFTKREFVIKLTGEGENTSYPNYVALELIKDKCALMDAYQIGDEIVTHFNLSGRLWAGNGKGEKCFTSLQAWKVAAASATTADSSDNYSYDQSATAPTYDDVPADVSSKTANSFDDDIPF